MITLAPGVLLIADPFLKDPNFKRTVVFLCEHREQGSFGIVINRAYESTLDQLITGVEGIKIPVYYGGPVQLDSIHFLHQYPGILEDGFKIMDGIYWGKDFRTAISMIRSGAIDTNKIRFYFGYSGWTSGQLDEEFNGKSWLTVPASANLVFHKQADQVWKDALHHLGGEYEMMANFPIDPRLN